MILLLGYIETSKIILSLRWMQYNIIVLTNRYPNISKLTNCNTRCFIDVTVKSLHTGSETNNNNI